MLFVVVASKFLHVCCFCLLCFCVAHTQFQLAADGVVQQLKHHEDQVLLMNKSSELVDNVFVSKL